MLYIPGSFLLGVAVGVTVGVSVGDGVDVLVADGVNVGIAVSVASEVIVNIGWGISDGFINKVLVGLISDTALVGLLTTCCETLHPVTSSIKTKTNDEINNDFKIHPPRLIIQWWDDISIWLNIPPKSIL